MRYSLDALSAQSAALVVRFAVVFDASMSSLMKPMVAAGVDSEWRRGSGPCGCCAGAAGVGGRGCV
eukprot:134827-Chlamydomonas_euryale.AAC.2